MRNLAKIFLLFFVAASATTIIACMLSKSGLPAAQPVGEMHADDFSHILRTHFCTVIGIASLVFFISASLTVSFFYAYRIRLIADRNLSILSMMPARIFIMDRDENLLYVHIHEDDPIPNPHVKKLREIENIDHEKMSKIFKDVFETRKSATVEYDYNGIKRIMRIAPIPDKIYGKEAIIWMSHSNSEFQDVRKFWDIVMNSVPFNFYAKDAANDFRYILCNDEFAKFLDRPKEQIIGSTDFELHGREKAEGVLEADKTVMARGIGIECTEDIVDARGRSRIVRTVKKPFVGVDGRRMLFSVSVDVTELEESKRMEAEHRGLLQALLDNLRIGIVVKDADNDFRYLMCNPSYCMMVGMEESEIIGRTDKEATFSEREDYISTTDREAVKNNKVLHSIETVNVPNFGRAYYEKFKIPITLADGKKLLMVSYTDVTKVNNFVEAGLITNESLEHIVLEGDFSKNLDNLFRTFAQHMDCDKIAFITYDSKSDAYDFHQEWIAPRSTGAEKAGSVELRTAFFASLDSLFKANRLVVVSDALNSKYAEFLAATAVRSFIASPVYIDGSLYGAVLVGFVKYMRFFSEIDENMMRSMSSIIALAQMRQRQVAEIFSALKKAQDADKAKSFFLASMSHEIRTPLNAVIGFSELLRDKYLTPEKRSEYLDGISSSGSALLDLINDILDLSKLEAGQMKFNPVKTDFGSIAMEVCGIFKQRVVEKGIACEMNIEPMPYMYIDRLRVRQILFNLVGNSVKFTLNGKITFSAKFEKDSEEAGSLIFSICDTGMGISPEDQKKLFEPFVQGDSARCKSASESGTGLGLVIVRRMLKSMNGVISLDSALNRGSTFTVRISDVKYDEGVAPCGAIIQSHDIPAFKNCSALLVDDVPMNLRVLGALLERIGVSTVGAVSAAEALEILKDRSFDIVMTDLWMPDMNGSVLASKIRESFGEKAPKIVAITADLESSETFDMKPFDSVVTKPVGVDKLKLLLETFFPDKIAGKV